MVSIQNQVVLITGASSGIGAACARVFAQAGAFFILVTRRQDLLEKIATEISQQFSCQLHLLSLDVRDRSQVEAALSSLPPPWSSVDILINNAGLSRGLNKLYEGSIQDWEEMLDTNVKGLLYVTRTIVPGMVTRGRGHIVNIGVRFVG
ncbi:MAG: hypothetical protein NVS2B14_00540 [Chamaesiphon sp.]